MSGERWHGTIGGYTGHACRCERCTEAARVHVAAWRLSAVERGVPDPAMHGKATTYRNWSCRCDPCKAAGAAYSRAARERRKAARR